MAALVCAETLRQEGFTGRIIMATSEKHVPYDKSKLTKVGVRQGQDCAWAPCVTWGTLRARDNGESKAGVMRHPKGIGVLFPGKYLFPHRSLSSELTQAVVLSPFIEFSSLKFDGFSEVATR